MLTSPIELPEKSPPQPQIHTFSSSSTARSSPATSTLADAGGAAAADDYSNYWLLIRGRAVKKHLNLSPATTETDTDADADASTEEQERSKAKQYEACALRVARLLLRHEQTSVLSAFVKSPSELLVSVREEASRERLMRLLSSLYPVSELVALKSSIVLVRSIPRHWSHLHLVDALATAYALQPSFIEFGHDFLFVCLVCLTF